MTLTHARTVQYIGILFSLLLIAVGYWYWSVRAGVKTSTGGLQPQGVGDLSAGLAGYWKLDETTGSTAADASTNANTGTLTNMENGDWVTGQIGNGLTFDGTDEYVTAGTNSALDVGTNPFSLSVWFKTTDTSGAIIGKGGTNSGGERYYIGTETADCTSGKVKVDIDDDTTKQFVCSTTTVTDNAWHQVALVRGRTTLEIYVDGKKEGTAVDITGYGSLNSTRPFTIGSMYDEVAAAQSSFFSGTVDEARLYHRALSADEVASLYRLTTPTEVDTSLKGYWSFNSDALSGTTAYDWSGAGKNGTLTNGPAINEGRVGQGLSFDGTNDYIATAATIPSQGSISVWAKPNFPLDPSSRAYFQNASESGGHFHFGFNAYDGYNTWELSYRGGYGSTVDIIGKPYTSDVDVQRWRHVVVSWDAATGGQMYVDGILVSSTTGTTGNFVAMPMSIGSDSGDFWKGNIDEVRLYNRILSVAEVKGLYDTAAPDKGNTSALQAQGNGRLDSGLAGYWKLDETTGSSAADASTNGNTGTLTNMENGDWVTGQIGNSLDFDGTNEYVSASATPFVSHSSGTITAWIKSTNSGFAQTIFGISTLASSNYAGFFATNSDGKLWLRIKGNGLDLVNCSVTDSGSSAQVAASGTWTFVAITNDATGKKFFKNAYQQGNDCSSDTTWFDDLSAQTPVDTSIGSWLVAGGSQQHFQGSIDEVRVYDHALSSDEIANLYRVTAPTAVDTGLKGYWSFNGQDMNGTTAFDRSGAGNTGTLTNGPAIAEGLAGQALSFDGVNDYVDTADIAFTGPFTFSTWFYTTSNSQTGMIFGEDGSNSGGGAKLGIVSGNLFVRVMDAGSSDTTVTAPAVNQWHHATLVRDGSNKVDLYIDGVFTKRLFADAVQAETFTWDVIGSAADLSQNFSGKLDEIRAYNRALTAAEIKGLYDISKPDATNSASSQAQGTGRLDSGLIGYWALDENTGTSATDTSTNGNNGTLTGGPTWTTGQIGSAVDFDGVDDNIATPSVRGVVNATTSVWIRPDSVTGTHTVIRHDNNFGIDLANDEIRWYWEGGSAYHDTTAANLSTGQWYHIVGTYFSGGSSNNVQVYVNGVAQTLSNDDETNTPSASSGVVASSWLGSYYDGQLDEVRIYDRTLSPDEVWQLYRLGTPTGTETSLKGYWSFNGQDMSGTMAYDRSGSGNNGTLTNSPAITEGKLGQGLSFDGTNKFVNAGDPTNGSLDPANITISAWVWRNGSQSSYARIVDKMATGGYQLYAYSTNNTLGGYMTNGVTPSGDINSGWAIPNQQWAHVALTYDGTNMLFYGDGVLVKTQAYGSGLANTTDTFSIGNNGSGTGNWNGSIDEVRVYDRALSASEIKTLYSSGK